MLATPRIVVKAAAGHPACEPACLSGKQPR